MAIICTQWNYSSGKVKNETNRKSIRNHDKICRKTKLSLINTNKREIFLLCLEKKKTSKKVCATKNFIPFPTKYLQNQSFPRSNFPIKRKYNRTENQFSNEKVFFWFNVKKSLNNEKKLQYWRQVWGNLLLIVTRYLWNLIFLLFW